MSEFPVPADCESSAIQGKALVDCAAPSSGWAMWRTERGRHPGCDKHPGQTHQRRASRADDLGGGGTQHRRLLENGPQTCDELAAATRTQSASLYRLLRALASLEIFAEVSERSFALTPLAQLLRSGVPGSLRALALFQNDDWYWQVYRDLPYSIRTGTPATDHLWGKGLFECRSRASDPSCARPGEPTRPPCLRPSSGVR
jgi:hypothetical protein